MKKLKTLLVAVTLCLTTTLIYAQTDPTGGGTGEPNPIELMFVSVTALGAAVTVVTGYLTTHIKAANSIGKQNVSWLVGIALGAAGHYFEVGIFKDLNWYWALGNGFLAALTSNAYANIDWVKALLQVIAAKAKF